MKAVIVEVRILLHPNNDSIFHNDHLRLQNDLSGNGHDKDHY